MTFIQSIILGIVQGITEFLPISSSAHLVLIPFLLNWNIPEEQLFPFDILVQLGTLVALIYYYREDLWVILKAVFKGIASGKPFAEVEARVGWLTLLASFPTGIVGLLLRKTIKGTFTNPAQTAVFLFITAALLVMGEVFGKKDRDIDDLKWKDALWIGSFQAISLLPGVSRSGSTITGGMTRNLKRRTAGQFSFLMAIPALAGAGLIGIIEMMALPDVKNFLPVMITGFIVAGIVGFFAISWLMKYINSHSLLPFAGYCLLLGAGSLALLTLNPQISTSSTSTAQTDQAGVYQIGFDPELEWLLPVMHNCQAQVPSADFIYESFAEASAASVAMDTYLSYELPQGKTGFTYQLGEDHLEVAVNPANNFNSAPLSVVNSLFAGSFAAWQSVWEACPECFTGGGSASNVNIAIWMLPGDSFPGSQFESAYLNTTLTSLAKIAPNSKNMRQMIGADANAVGYLPAGWLDDSVKALTISDEDWSSPRMPIIASTTAEPEEVLSLWLACVQKSLAR